MTQRVARLLHITDTHLHASPEGRMRGVCTDATLRAVLARALADDDPPDAILATGDLVQDETRAGYERLRELLSPSGLPVYCLPGNHDELAAMHAVLDGEPFQVCGEARLGNWSLLLLNSHFRGADAGWLSPEELQRVVDALARNDASHYLVCVHHQVLPMGSRWLDGVGLSNADDLVEVLDGHKRVRGVVWGHVHQASDRRRQGVRFLSSPSTCAQFLPNSDDFAIDARPPGFRWLNLHANGRIDTKVVWLEADS
ncbi:MAG: metallophosphoesterase [Chromatiales bacterium]|nr:MAG: metallophosphoesterase [Chromatiales bacterium]